MTIILFALLGLTSSCSKDGSEINEKNTLIQYVGTAIDTRSVEGSTRFIFTVSSKVAYPIEVYVKAVTSDNQTLTSKKNIIQPHETKEIYLEKPGLTFDKSYITSYKTEGILLNFPSFPDTKFPIPHPKFPTQN